MTREDVACHGLPIPSLVVTVTLRCCSNLLCCVFMSCICLSHCDVIFPFRIPLCLLVCHSTFISVLLLQLVI